MGAKVVTLGGPLSLFRLASVHCPQKNLGMHLFRLLLPNRVLQCVTMFDPVRETFRKKMDPGPYLKKWTQVLKK